MPDFTHVLWFKVLGGLSSVCHSECIAQACDTECIFLFELSTTMETHLVNGDWNTLTHAVNALHSMDMGVQLNVHDQKCH